MTKYDIFKNSFGDAEHVGDLSVDFSALGRDYVSLDNNYEDTTSQKFPQHTFPPFSLLSAGASKFSSVLKVTPALFFVVTLIFRTAVIFLPSVVLNLNLT